MGKISDALDKYAKERRTRRLSRLTRADVDALMAYDRETGHLLAYDAGSGQVGTVSIEILRNKGTLQRLLDNKLITPGGKLTPNGVRYCEQAEKRMPEARAPDPVPGKIEEATPPETKAFDDLKTEVSENPVSSIPLQKVPERIVLVEPGEIHEPATAPEALFNEQAIDKSLVSLMDPQSYESEQFKILRTNLLYPVSGTPPQSILVTSSRPGEGKSFVSSNLAISIAMNVNRHVLLIDCDLRKPDIHRRFGFGPVRGLSDYLSDHTDLASLLLKTKVDKLTILPGGTTPPNPSELMSSEKMTELLEEVKYRYHDRLIVIDTPPPSMAAETAFLARRVDGIVVVSQYGQTPRADLEDLIDRMGSEKIIGTVLNFMEARSRYYGYKRYGQYGRRYGYGKGKKSS